MKICHVTNYLPNYHKNWGGAERACYIMIKTLKKKDHKISVISTKPIKKPKEFDFYSMKTIEDYFNSRSKHYISIIKLGLFPFDPITFINSFKLLKKIKPDVLHFHNFNVLSFSLVTAAKILKIPILLTIYDYWYICPASPAMLLYKNDKICNRYQGPNCVNCLNIVNFGKIFLILRKIFFDYFLNKFDAFITLSKSSARILKKYGIEEEKIYTIPLILPLKKIESKRRKIEKNSIFYAGWVSPHKGLHILIKAMPSVLKDIQNAKLYVIGDTSVNKKYVKKIKRLIKKLMIEKNVFLLGKISDKDFEEFFMKSNVIVIPEQWENMSPVLLVDSMINAKPIVASRVGGIPEFITEGKNGFLCDPKNSKDFAKKIIFILKNRKMAYKMGKKARRNALKIFNVNKNLKNIISLYEKISNQ